MFPRICVISCPIIYYYSALCAVWTVNVSESSFYFLVFVRLWELAHDNITKIKRNNKLIYQSVQSVQSVRDLRSSILNPIIQLRPCRVNGRQYVVNPFFLFLRSFAKDIHEFVRFSVHERVHGVGSRAGAVDVS